MRGELVIRDSAAGVCSSVKTTCFVEFPAYDLGLPEQVDKQFQGNDSARRRER